MLREWIFLYRIPLFLLNLYLLNYQLITMKNTTMNTSWLHGKYPAINAEINTSLPYVSIRDWFFQGEEADNVINEIHQIWVNSNCTQEEAIKKWDNRYL